MGTAVSNPASFSSVRSACSAEGYGSSLSFTGYNRGGGIVPDHANTAGVSATDAGLALSQFSGITIPSSVVNHTVSINNGPASGACGSTNNGGNCLAVTNSVTATVSNGVGPFTYSWARVSGDTFTIDSSTSASTTFRRSGTTVAEPGTTYTGTYRCTVTDTGNSNYTASADVTVTTNHVWVV